MMQHPRSNVAAVIIRDHHLLLVEFDDDSGLHYNLPGGGVDLNEMLYDAIRREVWEETCARIAVGRLLAVWEYIPPDDDVYGNVHKITHVFGCELEVGSEPRMPNAPDKNQTGVRWVGLDELGTIQLYPDLGDDLLPVIQGKLTDVFYGTVR